MKIKILRFRVYYFRFSGLEPCLALVLDLLLLMQSLRVNFLKLG